MDDQQTKALIEKHEGRRKKLYRDSLGIETIGVGRNLRRGLTDEEVDYLFETDYREAGTIAWAFCGSRCWAKLDEVRQAVVCDMAFNLGTSRLKGFKRFRAALVAEDYALAREEMYKSKWYRQTKSRAKRLCSMMETGQW